MAAQWFPGAVILKLILRAQSLLDRICFGTYIVCQTSEWYAISCFFVWLFIVEKFESFVHFKCWYANQQPFPAGVREEQPLPDAQISCLWCRKSEREQGKHYSLPTRFRKESGVSTRTKDSRTSKPFTNDVRNRDEKIDQRKLGPGHLIESAKLLMLLQSILLRK
jgi:hypothetical protein